MERPQGDGVEEVLIRKTTYRQRDDVDAVVYGVIEGSKNVGIGAEPPAHLVGGDPRMGRATSGSAVGFAVDVCAADDPPCGRGERVGAVALAIAGRVLYRRRCTVGLMGQVIEPGTNQLPGSPKRKL